MPVSRALLSCLPLVSLGVFVGCSSSPRSGFDDPTSSDTPATTPAPATSSTGDFGNAPAPPIAVDAVPEVFGHSPAVLYKLDPATKAVTVIGNFKNCAAVIDIAVDQAGQIFGVSSGFLYKIDKTNASCTQIGKGTYPNSLSFVPVGTLDPSAEALVGYVGSNYVRIDVKTGATSTIGALGGDLKSSGDIVSVKGGASYLTVKDATCSDCLVEVDPKTGAMTKNWGSIGHTDVFGISFWGGKVYGFSQAGDLFEVTFTGSTITTAPIAIPSKPADLEFWGAGSTTLAPLVPTPS